ncbi:hypothetical protein ACT3SP_17720 [Brachybacterium sp. AOP43-C2-M15]|uniref:hypothetical protein n=1 Tax=Brachybacterium sp. AOP43-C2-M15 TaxID=3457661 RepID=UPI0040338F74
MRRAHDGPRRGREAALLPVRWSGLALAAGFAASGLWVEVAVAMLVALAQVVGWRTRLPLPWEVATSALCLLAAVSSFLLLYERFPWWDMPVHAALTGVLAVLVARVVRTRSPSVTEVAVTGAVLAVLWEVMELAGWHWVDSSVHVAPLDTALDLVAGMAGAVGAGLVWQRPGRDEDRRGDE